MNFKRKIRLFFSSKGITIFKCIAIIICIIVIIRKINNYIAYSSMEKSKQNIQNNIITKEEKKEIEEEENELDIFINLCISNEIEQAYSMLSEECKVQKYNTLEEFEKKYINIVYSILESYKIEYYDEHTYEVTYIQDKLKKGSNSDLEYTMKYYIEQDILGNKSIYIEVL